jgi:hypothetical protein
MVLRLVDLEINHWVKHCNIKFQSGAVKSDNYAVRCGVGIDLGYPRLFETSKERDSLAF